MSTMNSAAQAVTTMDELATAAPEFLEDAASLAVGLSPMQVAAFEVLTSGGTMAAAARAANVSRKTLYEWMREGHQFDVAYQEWKRSIAETSRTRLLMIGEAATVQIARSIKQGDTRAALAVAKGMGLLSAPPVGPSMTQSVAKKHELEVKCAEEEAADRLTATPFRDLVDVGEFRKIDEG